MLNDAKIICFNAINSCLPYDNVKKQLKQLSLSEDVYLVAVGKAAFAMAKAAIDSIDIKKGILITKYNHVKSKLDKVDCYEAGHPVLDQNGINASRKIIDMCKNLKQSDTVLFLLSGGASALFEDPLIDLEKLQDINRQMLNKGLDIEKINIIRKRFSRVKAGRFADICFPAKVYSIILSDVLDDKLDTIGSGPTVKDDSDTKQVLEIIDNYNLDIDKETREILLKDIDVNVSNTENIIIGSLKMMCNQALLEAEKIGYDAEIISDHFDLEYSEASSYISSLIDKYKDTKEKKALILGGEIVLNVKGNGLGGRCTQLAFSQIKHMSDMNNVLLMCVASDGTDGPTDAAGAYVNGQTYGKLVHNNIDFEKILSDNDTYHGFEKIDQLIISGPTGTNVNDLTLILIN